MKQIMKKGIMVFTIALALVFSLVPGVKAKAGNIERVEDHYQFDFKKTGTSSEVVSADTDMENYIGGKKEEFINSMATNGATTSADIDSLFSYERGDYKYAVFQSVISGTEPKLIDGTIKVIHISTIEYTEVTVTLAEQGTDAQQLGTIAFSLTEPKVGQSATGMALVGDNTFYCDTKGNETNGYLDFFGLGFVMGWSDSSGSHFEGIFEEGETYTYTIMINGLQPYYVGKNTVVTINGKPANCKKIYHDVEESDGYRYEEDYGFYSVTYSLAPSTYTVKFETGEGSKVELQEIESGKTATKPATDPTRAGYTFGGWYADEDRKTEYDFSKAILEDTTIYAKWSAEEKKPSYTILDGANQTLETGAGNDLAVRANGEVSKLIALNVDRKEVDKSNYIITEGSTIATIKAAFLDTLNEGEHTLTFVYTDGEVSTRFTIKKQATPTTVPSTPAEVTTPSTTEAAKKATATSPKTGDSLLVVPLGALMVISLIGILAMKKNKVK